MQAEAKPEETNESNMILGEPRQAGTLCKQVLLLLKTSVSTVNSTAYITMRNSSNKILVEMRQADINKLTVIEDLRHPRTKRAMNRTITQMG